MERYGRYVIFFNIPFEKFIFGAGPASGCDLSTWEKEKLKQNKNRTKITFLIIIYFLVDNPLLPFGYYLDI